MLGWKYYGQQRPDFAETPGPGQESVWDYPRPPKLVRDEREVVVRCGPHVVARTRAALKVCETASPPTFYLPPSDVHTEWLSPAGGGSFCEWKGAANYWSLNLPAKTLSGVAWSYERPSAEFAGLKGHLSFYPARVECYVDGHRVEPQPGEFYGGWITPELVGPFKGAPGTGHW